MTPVLENNEGGGGLEGEGDEVDLDNSDEEDAVIFQRDSVERSRPTVSYQASSPDEVCLSRLHTDTWH